jgi:threonine dehydratase
LGTELWVKHENQTPTGAFKARTAVVYVEELMKREPVTRGLIAAALIEFGTDYQAALEKAMEMVAEQQLHMVPPYHYDIVRGVASSTG